MLKFYILIYLLFVVAFPQEIEKKEIIYPEKIYHINFTDSITYIFNERGLHIFKIREGNVHEFLTALHFETSEGIVSEIKGSQFIIYKPDTLFYYDITNPECPVKVNQWNIQSGLKRITGFGDNYILFFSTSTYLTSVNADSVSFVNLITSLNNPRAANYPYFFLSVNNHLQCYRFLPDNSFYLERIITEEKNFAGVASSGNLLGYSTAYKIYGPWYTRIKIIDISQTDFPVLFDYYYYPYGAWGGVFWMESISNNYIVGWQEYGPDIHRAVLGMTGNVSKKFSIDYQVNLKFNNKFYAYSYINYPWFGIDTLRPKDLYGTFTPLHCVESIIKTVKNKVSLLKNSFDNKLVFVDSVYYDGNLITNDSTFLIRKSSSFKKYSILGNSIVYSDSFKLMESYQKVIDLGKYIYLKDNSGLYFGMKENSIVRTIFSSNVYKNTTSAFLFSNSIFVLDSVLGIVKFNITNDTVVNKQWQYNISNYSNSFTLKDSFIVLRDNKKLVLIDINSSITVPVIVDSFNLISALSYSDLITTHNGIYLKGKSNNSFLLKFLIKNGKFEYQYPFNLDNETDFAITEAEKKLLIVTPKEIYWVKDTTIASDIKYDYKEIPAEYRLFQNYPNPFNSTTTLSYRIADAGQISLKMYDILGREVMDILNERGAAGEYNHQIDCNNLPSGIYILRLRVNNFVSSKKIVVIR